MTRKSDELRAAVVAALMSGEGVNGVSRRFSLSKATVSRIKRSLGKDLLERIETDKGRKLEELVYSCLVENYKTLAFLAQAVRDGVWLKKNKANDVSILYQSMADSASRITEAVQAGESEPNEEGPNVEPN